MNSGGSDDCRSRGSREAIPKPISQTWPVEGLTKTFAGFISLWIRPRACNCTSAALRPIAKRKSCPSSIGSSRTKSSGSAPGSSSSRKLRSCSCVRARGRTAHAGSSSAFKENSCSILLRQPGAGCSIAGVRTRIGGGVASVWRRCRPRYRMNSPS